VRETGVDALAVAIGNSHGRYKGDPKLDFERLQAIREAVDIPLVLHGGSGIPAADFRKAIALGIAKINFFTGMAEAALRTTAGYLATAGERYNDYPIMLSQVKDQVAEVVAEQMEIFGSQGKAGL
jgi:fructose-bisphosphate aldolase, class II